MRSWHGQLASHGLILHAFGTSFIYDTGAFSHQTIFQNQGSWSQDINPAIALSLVPFLFSKLRTGNRSGAHSPVGDVLGRDSAERRLRRTLSRLVRVRVHDVRLFLDRHHLDVIFVGAALGRGRVVSGPRDVVDLHPCHHAPLPDLQ